MLSLTESHPLRIQTSKGLSISSAFIIFVLASFFRSCVLFPFVYQDMMFVFLFASLLNAQFLQKKSPFDWNQVYVLNAIFFHPQELLRVALLPWIKKWKQIPLILLNVTRQKKNQALTLCTVFARRIVLVWVVTLTRCHWFLVMTRKRKLLVPHPPAWSY